MSNITAREAIVLGLMTSARVDPAGANIAADFVERALKLCDFQIVTMDGMPAPSGGTVAELGAARPAAAKPQPRRWPIVCTRCNKVRNDQAHADECDDAQCPI